MKERRKARRYNLPLPTNIRGSNGNNLTVFCGEALDISTRGVCFKLGDELRVGTKLGLIMTVPAGVDAGMEVFILAVGQVVRVEKPRQGGVQNFRVAAAIKRYECFRNGISGNSTRLLSSLAEGFPQG